jgi:hypothetical protein
VHAQLHKVDINKWRSLNQCRNGFGHVTSLWRVVVAKWSSCEAVGRFKQLGWPRDDPRELVPGGSASAVYALSVRNFPGRASRPGARACPPGRVLWFVPCSSAPHTGSRLHHADEKLDYVVSLTLPPGALLPEEDDPEGEREALERFLDLVQVRGLSVAFCGWTFECLAIWLSWTHVFHGQTLFPHTAVTKWCGKHKIA